MKLKTVLGMVIIAAFIVIGTYSFVYHNDE